VRARALHQPIGARCFGLAHGRDDRSNQASPANTVERRTFCAGALRRARVATMLDAHDPVDQRAWNDADATRKASSALAPASTSSVNPCDRIKRATTPDASTTTTRSRSHPTPDRRDALHMTWGN
jgi:hypothetical protein